MYCTVDELKQYGGIDQTGDDTLLEALIHRAMAAIDGHTSRHFEEATATKYYLRDAIDDDDKFMLLLDDDLLSITTLTNGDSDGTAIPNTEYVLWPRNYGPPYWAIKMDSESSYSWEFDTDYYVQVAGSWGYSETPPADIRHCAIRLATYYYRQKDAQVFDVVAVPEAGVITIPQGIPADVRLILDRYRKMAPVL